MATGLYHSGLMLAAAASSFLAFALPTSAAATPRGFKSTLATADQSALDQLVIRALADPRIAAARARARPILEASPVAQRPDGQARLDYALDSWVVYLAYQEANADPARPKVLWTPSGSAYTWFGHAVPIAGASIDCPDNIYRAMPIDPASRYEIHGQLRPMHPAQFSFQLLRHTDTVPSGADSTSLGVLASRDMIIDANGAFTITVDGDPANGRVNHIQSAPGALSRLLVRDTTTSWLQSANELTVKRIGGPAPGPAMDAATLAGRVADGLSDWVSGWVRYISTLHGPPADNVLVPPYGRAGAWGYISMARFHLTDDQALVIKIDDVGAEYAGGQVTDLWGILTDPQLYISSFTVGQAHRNSDGTATFVIAPKDPGTANWMETAGMHDGWVAFRWQGIPRTRTNNEGLVRDFRVVNVSELAALLGPGGTGVTAEQRNQERQQRKEEWRLRIANGQ